MYERTSLFFDHCMLYLSDNSLRDKFFRMILAKLRVGMFLIYIENDMNRFY